MNLIDNGVHALLTHPDQLALLRTEPARLSAKVEELLWFDGPVQLATFQCTTAPVQIGTAMIPAGALVVFRLLAVNRDRSHIADPDVLDLTWVQLPPSVRARRPPLPGRAAGPVSAAAAGCASHPAGLAA